MSGSRAASRILFALIAVLSLAGIGDSAISLERHYAKSATTYCDFSQKFSCDIVNRSEYSEIAGIPVAGIGVAGYAALFALSTFWRLRTRNSSPASRRIAGRLGIRPVSDLYRSVSVDDVVHPLPDLAYVDLRHHDACGNHKIRNFQSMSSAAVVF